MWGTGIPPLNDDTRLMLYALAKQATTGPCKEPKPWGWNAVENAKWNSWNQLGNTSKEDAMRLFVRTLEDAQVIKYTVILSGSVRRLSQSC